MESLFDAWSKKNPEWEKKYAVTMFAVINTNEPIGDSP